MVLQAFDFLELARRYKCNMQMGGSDQWGNIINGIELGRKTDGLNLLGLTSPLDQFFRCKNGENCFRCNMA